MLKKLALKFRNQSLNEVKPYEPQLFLPHESDIEDLERSEDEDEEIRDLTNEPAALNFNNNYVDSSNSKSATSHPTLAASKEDIPPDGGRKLEEVESRFTPIYAPTVRDCCSSAEKRKWSQMNAHKLLQQFASGADSSSSDDEVKELCSKKSTLLPAFSSSPPGKVTILSHHSAFSRGRVRPTEGHARKKHRFAFAEYDEERPSLNFEKMQKVVIKKPHSIARPRVRIRTISNSSLRPSLTCNPEVLSFRPIQFNAHRSLAPVEEPGFVF